jgi:hypothetical protein
MAEQKIGVGKFCLFIITSKIARALQRVIIFVLKLLTLYLPHPHRFAIFKSIDANMYRHPR